MTHELTALAIAGPSRVTLYGFCLDNKGFDMTGILKAILFLIPAFALSIFAAFFARLRLEEWWPPSEGNWNAVLVSLLTLLTFAATMWLCGRLVSWWLKRRTEENEE